MKEIPLTKGGVALVDDEDFALVNQYKWQLLDHGKRQYAFTTYSVKNRTKHIYMHRLIMGFPKGKEIDHINFNGLDNRRSTNLRVCSKSQNHFNIRKSISFSRFKGVSWDPVNEKWYARIKINGKGKFLGRHSSEEEAAIAYDNMARELIGEFAILNFPVHHAHCYGYGHNEESGAQEVLLVGRPK
jgi:hypothetical protein